MKAFFITCWLLLLFSCQEKEVTTKPLVQNITESVYASGKIKSKDQYEVFASVNGIIQQILVTDGSVVRKGQVLMTLTNDAQQLNRENARIAAEYQSVQSNLDKLSEAEATISLARTKLQNDSLLLVRQRNLWANDVGSRNELEQRELAVRNSATAYQTALLRYRQLQHQLQFAEKQSRKNLQISTTVSNDYSIKAKQDGKVYIVYKEPGEIVNPQTPVAIIGNANDFVLELQVDEYDIAKVRLGQKVLITMDSYKGQVFDGVVTKIDPIMNDRSRSITIEATFINRPTDLLPNLTAEANVVIKTKQNALTIPREYLVDETYVVLQNNERRKVTVGLKDYQKVEITGGLSAGDVIKKPAP